MMPAVKVEGPLTEQGGNRLQAHTRFMAWGWRPAEEGVGSRCGVTEPGNAIRGGDGMTACLPPLRRIEAPSYG